MVNGFTFSEVIKTLGNKVDSFFEGSRKFLIDVDLPFEKCQQLFEDLFLEDHLRYTLQTVHSFMFYCVIIYKLCF